MKFKSDTQSEKTLSKEEFNNYTQMRAGILNLKGKRSDLFDMMRKTEKQMQSLQAEFAQNQEVIENAETQFQDFIDDLGKKYQLGDGIFNISETEPHIIKIVS
jgi:predicted DNA-binding ArsR family transcriptional regulator